MSRRNLFWLLGIAAVSLFGMAVSYSAPTREKDRDYELVRLVVDVLHEVRNQYVVDVSPERQRQLVEDMINGGLERLDPHSGYINARDYKQFDSRSEGKFGGVGIHVGFDPDNRGMLTVVSPIPGTPAYEAGVLAGDVIRKIDDKPTDSMLMSEAIDRIQGEPGTKVKLTLLRKGAKEPLDFTLTRAIIKVQSVLGDQRKPDTKEWDYFHDKKERIAYVRLVQFTRTTAQELRGVLEGLEKDEVRGLVLDLRNNPGGLLRAAVEVADLFLTDGVIVSTKGRNKDPEVFRAKDEGTLLLGHGKPVPMVVLINKYSASASEIVAAALQDHKRAVVVGERSYGKGSVQNIIMLENNSSALKLTTASYWRPSGKNIHRFPDKKDFAAAKIDPDEWGVQPSPGMEVKLKDEERIDYLIWRNDRDVVRAGAKAKPKEPAKDKDGKPKPPFVDRVMQKAIEHLKKELSQTPEAPVKRDA
jgi:carboxyl-terminal processing protease